MRERAATYFEGPEAWRAWLADHHATESALWVGFWKKHTGRSGLTYTEAVEQAQGLRSGRPEQPGRLIGCPRS